MLAFRLFLLPLFATFALAGIVVVEPTQGQNVTPSGKFVVQVAQPGALTGPIQVALVIGLQACPTSSPSSCNPGEIENVLFNGPFAPKPHGGSVDEPYQNFTVRVPPFFPQGVAVLQVVHIELSGAGLSLVVEAVNVTMNVIHPQ